MAYVRVSDDGNTLHSFLAYEDRHLAKQLGGKWNPLMKSWDFIFNPPQVVPVLQALCKSLPDFQIEKSIMDRLENKRTELDQIGMIIAAAERNDPVEIVVPGLKMPLYNYQKHGVIFGTALSSGLLIADSMGLGKSVQGISIAMMRRQEGAKSCLVVCPASLKYNWMEEVKKFAGEEATIIEGTAQERLTLWHAKTGFFKIVNYEIFVRDLYYEGKVKADGEQTKDTRIPDADVILRQGFDVVIVDECFPYNTTIPTNLGDLPIGEIVEKQLPVYVLSKDSFINEPSYRKVVRWIKKPLNQLVEVIHEYGSLICTPNHRLWTEERGYVQAQDACMEDGTTHLLVLPERIHSQNEGKKYPEVLQQDLCGNLYEQSSRGEEEVVRFEKETVCRDGVHPVQEEVYGPNDKGCAIEKDVFQKMHCSMASEERQEISSDVLQHKRTSGSDSKSKDRNKKPKSFSQNEEIESRPRFQSESRGGNCQVERNASDIPCQGRKSADNGSSTKAIRRIGGGMDFRVQNIRQEVGRNNSESSTILSFGHCSSRIEDMRRSGRIHTQDQQMEISGRQKREGFVLSRVVGVKVLERGDYERHGICPEQDSFVYNLEVAIEANEDEDSHCYVADGVLVSNCHLAKTHRAQRSKALKKIKAHWRVGLTGTPLDGRLEELHSIYEFLQPGLFRNRFQFLQHYADFDYFGGVKGYKHVEEFKQTIRPFYIRRLKSEVLKDLPDKVYQDVWVDLAPADLKTYKELAKRKHEITETSEAMTAVVRCRQFCDFPSILDLDGGEAKCEKLLELLEDIYRDPKVKVLIFTQYKQVSERLLKRLPYRLLYLCGETPHKERQAMCHRFNDDPEIRIMVMTDAGALGLNLTGASYVIMFSDNYSPAVMDQRSDRAHRIGQKACVNVIRFICRDTVEERVREILARKQRITSSVLDEDCGEYSLGGLSPKDLLKAL